MKKLLIITGFVFAAIVCVYAQHPSAVPQPLNINFKNRGYFYAASPYLSSTAGFGGWGESENGYQHVDPSSNFEKEKLSVVVDTSKPRVLWERYRGYTLYVVNTQADTLFFQAQDSRLNMKLQAQDKNGVWKDIEYLPSSWCGNSYHLLYLPAEHYWEFTVPQYEGKMKTRIRVALQWKPDREGEEHWVYSNEFEGSINRAQFTKILKYTPNGLMDPYNN